MGSLCVRPGLFLDFARGRPPLVPLCRGCAEPATYFVETLVDIHGRHDEEVLDVVLREWCYERLCPIQS